jgi:hypothetical protein
MGETSGSGAPIHRHTERATEPEAAVGDEALVDEITAHVERHLGPVPTVNHELVSVDVHVDVLHVPPREERPCHTLVTCGMSAKPMAAPDPALERAELLLVLPPSWDLADEREQWPIGVLRFLSHMPHEYATWLGEGHTVPNGDPPEPYARGTKLCGAMLVEPTLVPDGFEVLERADGPVRFYGVALLHADEMELKLAEGADALLALLDATRDVPETLRPDRPSVAPPRKRRSLFRRR